MPQKYPLLHSRDWLVDAYVTQQLSTEAIARLVGCKSGAVCWAMKKLGIPSRTLSEAQALRASREEHGPSWRGGKTCSSPYVMVYHPTHPGAHTNGYVPEHRLVAEHELGRRLKPTEVVHHLDGDKTNNKPENLMVCNRKQHPKTHHATVLRIAELEAENARLRTIIQGGS